VNTPADPKVMVQRNDKHVKNDLPFVLFDILQAG
jgi:hypothetical protein